VGSRQFWLVGNPTNQNCPGVASRSIGVCNPVTHNSRGRRRLRWQSSGLRGRSRT